MFAVMETGGKQYLVKEGDVVKIEKLPDAKKGRDVLFEKVLLKDDGTNTNVGAPYLSDVKIKGEIVDEGRDRKIEVVKYKAKSRYFKLRGHRQPFMKARIVSL